MPSYDCDAHGWNFEPDDTCPVCDGIRMERDRVLDIIESDEWSDSDGLVALIEADEPNIPYELPKELREALDRITIWKKP